MLLQNTDISLNRQVKMLLYERIHYVADQKSFLPEINGRSDPCPYPDETDTTTSGRLANVLKTQTTLRKARSCM